jgi:hypothetical protein
VTVADETRAWIEEVVVGLDLCPFAAAPLRDGRVRIALSEAREPERLASDLADELRRLDRASASELETTLLVHPHALRDFDDYNQFLAAADAVLEKLGLVGTIQIASFHPDYCFDGVASDDPANATNRSPHPMLHLLREASVAEAVASHPDPDAIPARNAAKLRLRDRPPA